MSRRRRRGDRWGEAAVSLLGAGAVFLLLAAVLPGWAVGDGSRGWLAWAGAALLGFGACLGWVGRRRRAVRPPA